MSAGTVGFTDTRKDTNHIGMVISRILEARKLAEEERSYAESVAEKYQTSLEEAGIGKGFFFKKALRWKFGGEYKQKKISQIKTWKSRGSLLKSAIVGRSGKNKLNKFERAQAVFDMFKSGDKASTFRDKFKPLYQGFVEDPMLQPKSKMIKPGTAAKTQKALSKKKRVSKEDILDSLGAITESIQSIAESISEKNKVVADQMIHSSVLQGMMHQQLKSNADSLDDKLQKIINALSNQTQVQKDAIDRAESKQAEQKLERQKDVASIVNFDNLLTKEDESKIPATSAQDIEFQQMAMYEQNNIPKAETGAIFSGPDSGYLAELHGDEVVIPINNNYTQGEPSAVDGKVRKMPKYEMGTSNLLNDLPTYQPKINNNTTVNTAPITSKFGFNTMNNITGIAGGGTTEASKLVQANVDLMSLGMMATGGTILAATTKYMERLGSEASDIMPEIEKIARPIADVFGLPQSIVSATKMSLFRKKASDAQKDREQGSSKNIFSRLIDGFGNMLKKLGESINQNQQNPPGVTGPGVDFSGNKPSVEVPVQQKVLDTFENTQNWSIYRETIASKESSGSYDPTPGRGGGAGGNYEGRYQINHEYLDDIAKMLGEKTPTREQFRKDPKMQERFMQAYTMDNDRILKAHSPKYTKMSKKEQMAVLAYAHSQGAGAAARWVESGMGAGTKDQWGTAGRWYYENVQANLNKTYPTKKPEENKPTTKPQQLGQAITNNYGLQVGQERTFNVPGYGEVKAHKTRVGFDFYKGMTKLDMSPGNPHTKAILEEFQRINGGNTQSNVQQSDLEFERNLMRAKGQLTSSLVQPPSSSIPSLQPSSSKSSGGGGITVLNTGGGQQIASAGSSPQPSGEFGIESGVNPLQNSGLFETAYSTSLA